MVTLIVTEGTRSLDIYSKKLGERIRADKLRLHSYSRLSGGFNLPLFSASSLRALWGDWRMVVRLRRLASVLHLPNQHFGRYGNFLKAPFIITVHDLIRYLDMKGLALLIRRPNPRDRLYLGLDYKGIKRAARVIAVSKNTKRDLVVHLGIEEERIAVIYEGVDHRIFKPLRAPRPLEEPYLLYVGSEHPRKNLALLLKAFKALKERGFRDLKLVKVGEAGGSEADFRAHTQELIRALRLEGEVIFTGYLEERELARYYSFAECFVCPSLYEGFGLTSLEAMACGCPVIASNAASLPEVVGDAGILFDPLDEEELVQRLEEVLSDSALRSSLSKKGIRRAKQFSWERCARETERIYREVEEAAPSARREVEARTLLMKP